MRSLALLLAAVTASTLTLACAVPGSQVLRSNSLEYLYPEGAEPAPAQDVTLQIPVRVGLAFAPGGTGTAWTPPHPISEDQRVALLERIGAAFRQQQDIIGGIEVIPSTYLTPGGGFENLDRLRAAFGVDLMVLLSYEQTRFSDTTGASLAYWTVLGAYLVKGEKNETRTILEAVVYDITSRALLFRASGSSASTARATPIGVGRVAREEGAAGFETATDELIASLQVALDAFKEQASQGTVRGVGTPALSVVDASGAAVQPGGGGAGSVGALELVAAGLLVMAAAAGRRRNRAAR